MSVVPLLCHFIAECGHDEGGIIVGREVSLMESFSVMNVILLADPITVLTTMEKGKQLKLFPYVLRNLDSCQSNFKSLKNWSANHH